MRTLFFSITLLLLILLVPSPGISNTVAFGYLKNETKNANFEYLETMFPNSFANSIRNIFKIKVIKPHQVSRRLKKYKIPLKKNYKSYELPELLDKIKADSFIYGKFAILGNNRIRIVLNLYSKGTNRVFRFTNVGTMETEIFKLVDRITMILVNFSDKEQLYQKRTISKRSRVAFITNLNSVDLNVLYYSFMKEGFRLSHMQANSLRNYTTLKEIKPFYNIETKDNAFTISTDLRKVKFLIGPWSGKRYQRDVLYSKKIFKIYDINYSKTKSAVLDAMRKSFNNTIDYLIIIGFNKGRNTAWARCIYLPQKDLIWMQKDIKGSSIQEIAQKMIKRLTKKGKSPFKK